MAGIDICTLSAADGAAERSGRLNYRRASIVNRWFGAVAACPRIQQILQEAGLRRDAGQFSMITHRIIHSFRG
jgi:hypothetical protein